MRRIVRTVAFAAIGMAIGYVIFWDESAGIRFILAIACAGIPAGWNFIGRHFGHTLVFGNSAFVALWVCMQIIVSFLVGWIVTFINIPVGIYEIAARRELSF